MHASNHTTQSSRVRAIQFCGIRIWKHSLTAPAESSIPLLHPAPVHTEGGSTTHAQPKVTPCRVTTPPVQSPREMQYLHTARALVTFLMPRPSSNINAPPPFHAHQSAASVIVAYSPNSTCAKCIICHKPRSRNAILPCPRHRYHSPMQTLIQDATA